MPNKIYNKQIFKIDSNWLSYVNQSFEPEKIKAAFDFVKKTSSLLFVSAILAGLFMVMGLSSCNRKTSLSPQEKSVVVTSYDPSVNIRANTTYYISGMYDVESNFSSGFSPSHNATLNDSIKSFIVSLMKTDGYDSINANNSAVPNLRISIALINKDGIPLNSCYPYLPGWGDSTSWKEWTSATPATTGTDSCSVQFSSLPDSEYVIKYDAIGNLTVSDPVVFKAVPSGVKNPANLTYEFFVNGKSQETSDSKVSTFDLTLPNFPGINKKTNISVRLYNNNTLVAYDSVSVYGVQKGSEQITTFLTNPMAVVLANRSGHVDSLEKSGGNFLVYRGDSLLSDGCLYYISDSSHVSAQIDKKTGKYSISALSADIGSVTFKVAIFDSINKNKDSIFSIETAAYKIYKSKPDFGVPGYYPPNFISENYYNTYSSRTLLIEIADPKNHIVVNGNYVTPIYWTAKIMDAIPATGIFNDNLKAEIKQAFADSPYLQR